LKNLQENEDFHRKLIQLSPNGIIVHAEGKILFANQVALDSIGAKTFADIVDRPVLSFVHPDYREIAIQRIRAAQIHGKDNELIREKFIRLDGSVFDVEVAGAPISYQGSLASLLVIRDISEELKISEQIMASENKFRTLFEETRDAIYISSIDGTLLEVNQSMIDLFGYGEELLKVNAVDLYANPADRKKFREYIEKHEFVKDYIITLKKKNGEEFECMMSSTIRHNLDGSIAGYQGIIRDISDKMRIRETMIETSKIDSLGTLASGLAHDFNNLLMAIMGYMNIARSQLPADSPSINLLDDALASSKKAGNLTRQLLAYSGRGRITIESHDVNELLTDMKRLLKVATSRSLKINYSLSDDLPRVRVDTSHFTQLIANIVVNAYESITDGKGIVEITTGVASIDENFIEENLQFPDLVVGTYISIIITDNGTGIDKEKMSKIFDPFYSTKYLGRGLGLAAALGIVRSHKGAITVKSDLGIGSTFQIILPIDQS
jgi:PAS domain S-box-containing protein